eukprot:4622304-Alexandrium_andersonii.AAC.1
MPELGPETLICSGTVRPSGALPRRRHLTQHAQRHATHNSAAPGTNLEVVSGAAQLKLQTLEAILRLRPAEWPRQLCTD